MKLQPSFKNARSQLEVSVTHDVVADVHGEEVKRYDTLKRDRLPMAMYSMVSFR